jgi:uncharacterized protein (TIGR02996 family)
MSEVEAFETALAADPDDLATYSAYADWLQERDDPRGEFIAVQLALEDASRSGDERDALKAREAELLAAHEREWLGELAPHFLDRDEHAGPERPAVEHWWARGFFAEMKVQFFTAPLASAVARAPAARFLRKLQVESAPPGARESAPRPDQPDLLDYLDMPAEDADSGAQSEESAPPRLREYEPYFKLLGAPCLRSLRVFQFGADVEPEPDGWTGPIMRAPGLERLVASMPRIEELYLLGGGYNASALFALSNLSNLQVLRVYGLDVVLPLHVLARNPALGNLTHLLVHPQWTLDREFLPLDLVRELVNAPHLGSLSHLQLRLSNIGDEGVTAIIGSGILRRLGWLDLRNGTITDAGASALAQYAGTRSLRRLDLSRNAVTSIGVNQLKRAGVNVVMNNALSDREQDARDAELREEERYERARREGDWE